MSRDHLEGSDGGRISVSEDKLYRALGELELRLVEKLATNQEVGELRAEVSNLKTWQARMGGALALLYVLLLVGGPIVLHVFGVA